MPHVRPFPSTLFLTISNDVPAHGSLGPNVEPIPILSCVESDRVTRSMCIISRSKVEKNVQLVHLNLE